MNCQTQQEDFLFGMMDEAQEQTFRLHREQCEACREAVGQFNWLAELSVDPITEDEHLLLLQAAFATEEQEKESFLSGIQKALFGETIPWRLAWLSLAAACLLFVYVAGRVQPVPKRTKKTALTYNITRPLKITPQDAEFAPLQIGVKVVTPKKAVVHVPSDDIEIQVVHKPDEFLAVSIEKKETKKKTKNPQPDWSEDRSYSFALYDRVPVKNKVILSLTDFKKATYSPNPPQLLRHLN